MNQGYELTCNGISVHNFTKENFSDKFCGDHCHDHFEITYFISTFGKFIVEGSEHKVEPGTLILIKPMAYHNVSMEIDNKSEGYTIYFTGDALPEPVISILESLSTGKENYGRFYSSDLISDSLVATFDRLELARGLNDNEQIAFVQALITEILVLLSATKGEQMTRTDEELGSRVAKYINNNIEKNISLDRLARRFFVSKYHLCRAFKSHSGISVHAYINRKRIIYAKGLIESGMTASQAAERVGFGDYSAFYRAYIKIVGKSPTA